MARVSPGTSEFVTVIDPGTESGPICLRLALVAVIVSVVQAAIMVTVRTGLPTPPLAFTVGPAILACAVLGPSLWALRRPDRVIWIGPLAMAVLLIGLLLTAFGLVPIALIMFAALMLLGRGIWRLGRPGLGARRTALWLLLLLALVVVTTVQVAGIKYVNYVADQLMLAGRTDGDLLMHAAMSNAIRYFHLPSTGIDGVHFSRYHFGIDLLAAALSRGADLGVLLAMIEIKVLVLLPLLLFGAGWGGLVIGRALMPGTRLSALAFTCSAAGIAFLLQETPVGNLVTYSDPLLLSGVLMVLIAPTVVWVLVVPASDTPAVRWAWALAVLGIVLISAGKISNGFVWAGLVGYWALRRYRLGGNFWLVAFACGLAFLPCYLLFVDAMGGRFFGTPFFVEYGFAAGHYLLPLTVHFQALAAIVWLALQKQETSRPTRRFLLESLAIAIFGGVLPGLLMEIPNGDGFYFTQAVGWFSLPVLAALLAALPDRLVVAPAARRKLVWSGFAALTIAAIVFSATSFPLRFNIFMAYNALLHTADRSYYDVDKRRAWREDGQRAWATYGLGVFRLPAPPQLGQSLADALVAFKAETGNQGAAFIPPQSDYWPLVSDCDGKVTYPMSVAGVPLIDGYLPVQAECPQQFSLRGYAAAPATRGDLSDQELCSRARQAGFSVVLRTESVSDRSRDRKIACAPAE
ncbi:hypothetical protein [Dongia sedimenti]|uniref:Glycosyltransferase RgtA/B/C/D-like domain-containing protein n=1 Tax=Dongia sedimenti TaxID=3064282 RepID=A0ABU0YH36_9PROT|nr:hypothetical protein [Rhodospirillaceae bacterium R-7]